MVEMVAELKKIAPNPDIDFMIEEAEAGEYHDFKNVKYACGKMESANRLHQIGLKYPAIKADCDKIRGFIINGDYDEKPDAEDTRNTANIINKDPNMTAGQKEGMKKALGIKDNVRNGPFGKKFF